MKTFIFIYFLFISISTFSQVPMVDFIIDKDTSRPSAPYQVLGIEPNYYIADSVHSILLRDNSIKYCNYYNIVYNTCTAIIPEKIQLYKNLVSFDCQCCCIKKETIHLPKSFINLKKLELIDIRAFSCDSNTFPLGFDSLKKIKILYIGDMLSPFIPNSFYNLDSLEEFQIGFNGIKNVEELNESIKKLGSQNKIKYIHIWNYRISQKEKEKLIIFFKSKDKMISFGNT